MSEDHKHSLPEPGSSGELPGWVAEVQARWGECCTAQGCDPALARGENARRLVEAIADAAGGRGIPANASRAAHSWGASCELPADAAASIACLREVLSACGPAPGPAWDRDRMHQSIDRMLVGAVEAATSGLREEALTDPLTGCANRRGLERDLRDAISSARRSGTDVAVIAIDLDGLKSINDTLGHTAGDAALVGLARAVQAQLRDSDTFYRVGGDEFVILSPFTDAAGASGLMQRVRESGAPSFSFGIASMLSGEPESYRDPARLLELADSDLYARRRERKHLRRSSRYKKGGAIGLAAAALAAALFAATATPPAGPSARSSGAKRPPASALVPGGISGAGGPVAPASSPASSTASNPQRRETAPPATASSEEREAAVTPSSPSTTASFVSPSERAAGPQLLVHAGPPAASGPTERPARGPTALRVPAGQAPGSQTKPVAGPPSALGVLISDITGQATAIVSEVTSAITATLAPLLAGPLAGEDTLRQNPASAATPATSPPPFARTPR